MECEELPEGRRVLVADYALVAVGAEAKGPAASHAHLAVVHVEDQKTTRVARELVSVAHHTLGRVAAVLATDKEGDSTILILVLYDHLCLGLIGDVAGQGVSTQATKLVTAAAFQCRGPWRHGGQGDPGVALEHYLVPVVHAGIIPGEGEARPFYLRTGLLRDEEALAAEGHRASVPQAGGAPGVRAGAHHGGPHLAALGARFVLEAGADGRSLAVGLAALDGGHIV
mmetsp:Transcript_78546/g.177394  ORF Transcript_78546/g.177394 Transcript_78546/m.177394 type:complete len:227 (-) Transcript_78546:184-864(-)